MSYAQAMRWHKKHPTGGKPQYMGFSTGSGFWPSIAFSSNEYGPYLEQCQAIKTQPLSEEALYRLTLRSRIMCGMTTENRAEYTRLMRIRAQQEPLNNDLNQFRP